MEQLKAEVQTVQQALNSYQRRITEAVSESVGRQSRCGYPNEEVLPTLQEQAAAQREELLMRRYTPNVSHMIKY